MKVDAKPDTLTLVLSLNDETRSFKNFFTCLRQICNQYLRLRLNHIEINHIFLMTLRTNSSLLND